MLEKQEEKMEGFEKYRKDLAEKLKNTPKEERKALLEKEKNSEEYKKAKNFIKKSMVFTD